MYQSLKLRRAKRGTQARSDGCVVVLQHYITALGQDAPPEWQGKFLDYKVLKKMLKTCPCAAPCPQIGHKSQAVHVCTGCISAGLALKRVTTCK